MRDSVPYQAARPPTLAFAAVLAASIVGGVLVYGYLVLPAPLPVGDEARHLLQGARIASDLRGGHLTALVIDTYLQVYFPPLHPWLVALASLLLGPGEEAGRSVSVLSYVLLPPVLFLIALKVEPRHGIIAGILAAALAMTSPGLVEYAGAAMLELPGLLAMSCVMLVYCALENAPGAPPRAHAVLGVSVVVTYLIKTNYGVLVVIALLLARLFVVRFRLHRLRKRENLFTILPLALFLLVWFAWPKKIVWTWNALVNQPWGGEAARGLAGLLFFPRAVAEFAGSWWLAALLWMGLAMAWRIRHRPGVAFVALLPIILFLIGEIHHTKLDRHILPMLPAMFVLTGVAGAHLWARLNARGRAGSAVALGSVVFLALLHASSLVGRDRASAMDPGVAPMLDFVSGQIAEGAPALVLGTREAKPTAPGLDWYLVSRGLLPITGAGAIMNVSLDRRLRSHARRSILPAPARARLVRALGRYDRNPTSRSLYAGDRGMEDPARFERILTATIRRNPPRSVIALIATDPSARFGEDFVAGGLLRDGYRRVSVTEFPRAGVRVYLYEPMQGGDDVRRRTSAAPIAFLLRPCCGYTDWSMDRPTIELES